MPERPEVPIRRAVPVAGPGIETKYVNQETMEKVSTKQAESEPAVRRQKDGDAQPDAQTPLPTTNQRRGRRSADPERRHNLVDLETVMDMLEMVKPQEHESLKSMIHVFNQLTPTARFRLLKVINKIFG